MSRRMARVNKLIRQEISTLLQRQVKDPRLGNFIAVTEVDTSPDLKYARIYVSGIDDRVDKEQTLSALTVAASYIRRELYHRLRLKRIPELGFQWDDSVERGSRILELIDWVSSEQQ
jgi:ribosome-binding factor A